MSEDFQPKIINHLFILRREDELPQELELKVKKIEDGYDTTFKYPCKDDSVIIKGEQYVVNHIAHSYDDNVIIYDMYEVAYYASKFK